MLFLTNKQAGLVASKQRSIKLLFEFLEMPEEPKLVINLLHSQGTVADTLGKCTNGLARINDYLGDGRVRGVHPWKSIEEATRAEQKLDDFMEHVLIPIAERNNAVVVCECLKGDCFLSASFNRVMAMQASRHAGAPKITVIAFSCDLESLYRSNDPNAKWRSMRSKSLQWRVREKGDHGLLKLKELENYGHYKHYGSADLDMSAANFIIVDGIDHVTKTSELESGEKGVKPSKWGSRHAFNQLKMEVVRFLTTSVSEGGKGLPSIALKTGYSARDSLDNVSCRVASLPSPQGSNSSGLLNAVACLESGQSLIFLDLRNRTLPSGNLNEQRSNTTSKDLPAYVLNSYVEGCEKLFPRQNGDGPVSCDYFDVMAAAYCWMALHNTSDSHNKLKPPRFVPLCEAIRLEKARAEGGTGQLGGQSYGQVATASEVKELAWLLANKLLEDAFEVYFKYEILDAKNVKSGAWSTSRGAHHVRVTWGMGNYLPGGDEDVHAGAKPCNSDPFSYDCIKEEMLKRYLAKHMETQIKATAASLGKILNHDKFRGCNVTDADEAKRLVETLVKQDRLPAIEEKEGLLLLQQAWNEYDVAVHLAAQYNLYSYLFYAVYLVLGLAVVIVTAIASEGTSQDLVSFKESLNTSKTLYELQSLDTPLKEWLAHVIFGLSLAASLLLSFQSYLNPTQRAEQLRSSAASLESITWLYRTKVGPFEYGSADILNKAPEHALLRLLTAWNADLVAGTDLEQIDLKKKFPAKIYKHFQTQCAENHPRRKKAELQQNKIEALELQLSLIKKYPELIFDKETSAFGKVTNTGSGRISALGLVVDAGKRLTLRLNPKWSCCATLETYDGLRMKGAQYRTEKNWIKAARAYRKAIALKGNEPEYFDKTNDMLRHMLGEFRLGEMHMQLGEEDSKSYVNQLLAYFFNGPIAHYEKAAGLFREVELFFKKKALFFDEMEAKKKAKMVKKAKKGKKAETKGRAPAGNLNRAHYKQNCGTTTYEIVVRLRWRVLALSLAKSRAAAAAKLLASKAPAAKALAAAKAPAAKVLLAAAKSLVANSPAPVISPATISTDAQTSQARKMQERAARQHIQDMMANEQIKLDSFDDHQSPVRCEAYVQLRVQPAIEGYNKSIPYLMHLKNFWQVILLLCTASAAALSYAILTRHVVIVSATAAAISAWITFGNRSARLVRCTRTVRKLEQHLAWWSTQSDAEKSAKMNEFVTAAELIITSERQAWQTLEQTAGNTNGDASAKEKRGGKTRSETARKTARETGHSDTGPVDIETGQQ